MSDQPRELQDGELLRDRACIGGQWISHGDRIEVRNPADGRLLGTVPRLGELHVTQAVESAHAAFKSWSCRTAEERSRVLRHWFDLVTAATDDLALILTLEQGKPLAEARGEIAYAASYIDWFAEEARRTYGDVIPPTSPTRRLAVIKQPIGVVAAITPWNFPSAMITRKVAPALAVGCTVVLKPSELTPLSALALAFLAERAGVPAGVLNVVTGDAAPIGSVLTGHRLVRKLSFTGSTRVGTMLASKCLAGMKRVSLELGGNAPFIVFEDADVDAAVQGAIQAKFRNAGQTCVCANRILVHRRVADEFCSKLAARASTLVVGNGLLQGVEQGPLVSEAAIRKVQQHIDDAVARGARILTGGKRRDPASLFFAPTVLCAVPPESNVFREETFGPLAAVAPFDSEAAAVALANDTDAGLAAYVYTRDLSRATRVSEALEYGMVGVNTGLVSSAVAPFGGVKHSGMGREGSHYGVDDYLNIKLISTEIQPA